MQEWPQMVYLLFRGEAPSPAKRRCSMPRRGARERRALATLPCTPPCAQASADRRRGEPGWLRSQWVPGSHTGARDVYSPCNCGSTAARSSMRGLERLTDPVSHDAGIWPEADHPRDPHGRSARAALFWKHSTDSPDEARGKACDGLHANRSSLETLAAQAAVLDSGWPRRRSSISALRPIKGEMLHLLLRCQARDRRMRFEQRALGHKNFPFFALDLQKILQGR